MLLCRAHTRQGNPCKKPAVTGGTHCREHGGKALLLAHEASITHGAYVKTVPTWFKSAFDSYYNDPDLANTRRQLAIANGIFDRFFANWEDAPGFTSEQAQQLMAMLDNISTLVSRYVDNQHKDKTASSTKNLIALLAQIATIANDAINRNVSSPEERAAACEEIRAGVAKIGVNL